jgi:peptidyl-tRNA hydrolase, PTH1 family
MLLLQMLMASQYLVFGGLGGDFSKTKKPASFSARVWSWKYRFLSRLFAPISDRRRARARRGRSRRGSGGVAHGFMKTRFRAGCQCLLLGERRLYGVFSDFSMNLQIIAGLGNPGREYEKTRHNVGFMLVDELCAYCKGEWKNESRFDAIVAKVTMGRSECLIVKPQTFMNESGRAIGALARYYGVPGDKIIVAHDEYQIPVGELKLTIGGGDSGHNGVASVIAHVGNTFLRYRLGIGNERPLEEGIKGFVLDRFEAPEMEILKTKLPEFASGVRLVVDSGPIIGMNRLNKRTKHNDRNATA